MSTPAIPALTPAQMAQVDRLMTERFAVDVLQLVEQAGRAVAVAARQMLPQGDPRGRKVLILAGRGGNGGDGLAAGRLLHAWGATIEVRLSHPPERLNAAAMRQFAALQALAVPLVPPPGDRAATSAWSEPVGEGVDLMIDALLGFGLSGAPSGPAAALIALANASPAPVLAVDLPSGLDGASGQPFPPCVRADRTITLALPKTGLLAPAAAAVVGRLAVADIGIPPAAYAAIGIEVGPLFAVEDALPVVP